jgi:hypothetical protein
MDEPKFAAQFEDIFRTRFAVHADLKSIGTKQSRYIGSFYCKAAKLILESFDVGDILRRTGSAHRDFARIVIDEREVRWVLERQKNYIPELVPEWASGRAYVFYLDAFLDAFPEALNGSLRIIVRDLISTDDLMKLEVAVETTAKSAPRFEPINGRLKFQPAALTAPVRERKTVARQKCAQAKELCERRANEHPDIKRLVDQYDDALRQLRRVRGAYRFFLAGLEIETLLQVKSSLPYDEDRNPKIDADLLFALSALTTAHAGLVMLFPDVTNIAHELDEYRRQSASLDALRNRILDPVLESLSASKGVFDKDTQHLTGLVTDLGAKEKEAGLPLSTRVVAVKHSWLRGTLAAIGQLILQKGSEFAKAARDGMIGGAAYDFAKEPGNLVTAVAVFLMAARDALLRLADTLPVAFGWLRQMLGLLGL